MEKLNYKYCNTILTRFHILGKALRYKYIFHFFNIMSKTVHIVLHTIKEVFEQEISNKDNRE